MGPSVSVRARLRGANDADLGHRSRFDRDRPGCLYAFLHGFNRLAGDESVGPVVSFIDRRQPDHESEDRGDGAGEGESSRASDDGWDEKAGAGDEGRGGGDGGAPAKEGTEEVRADGSVLHT